MPAMLVAKNGERETRLPGPWEPAAANRWLLLGTEALQTVLLLSQRRLGSLAVFVLGGVLLYNAASLVVLRFGPLRRRAPIALLVVLDLLLVCAAASVTGASKSPFLGQFYLIIFAGSLFFGLAGGIATGIAAALLTAALGLAAPDGLRQDVRDLIPYFPITGAFTGYLSARLRQSAERQLAEAERERERQAREEAQRYEMGLARSIQEAAALPGLNGGGIAHEYGLDVAVYRTFAREVGGDFALTFPDAVMRELQDAHAARPPSRTLGLVVGDVSGKGIPAALTANSIAYLMPWLRPLQDAGRALAFLNRDLARRLPASAFVTMAFAEVSVPEMGACARVRLWSAGHPPAILWRARTGRTEITGETAGGPVLGIFPEWEARPPQEMVFEPGDVLVLYSDGLIETRRQEDGELFGTERVADTVAACAGEGADALARSLARAANEWGAPHDDLTILVCRYALAALS